MACAFSPYIRRVIEVAVNDVLLTFETVFCRDLPDVLNPRAEVDFGASVVRRGDAEDAACCGP